MKVRTYLLSLLALGALVFGQPALALTVYPDVVGTNVTFTSVQEASTFGDPEPLFGAPSGLDNQLLFFPASFSASSAGGGLDQTGSQFQAIITGNTALDVINRIKITEFGDQLLTGAGTAGTGTFASMSGFVTVTATTTGAITPLVIPWQGAFSTLGGAAPSNFPPDLLTDVTTHPGTTLWTGFVDIDIEQALIDAGETGQATSVFLSYDNNLVASSEAGTSSLIQKKVVGGPAVVIEVIPEPGTGLLLAGGLLALGIRRRRARV